MLIEEREKLDWNRERVGLVLRVYARKEEQIPESAKEIETIITKAKTMHYKGKPIFGRIDVMVWNDNRYVDSDCGKTYEYLESRWRNTSRVFVNNFTRGDLYCEILNKAIGIQVRNRIDYSMILSYQALSYFNEETVVEMLKAAEDGALAIGVGINELSYSIMKEGRIANTFAMWHNLSLIQEGIFDVRAAKNIDPNLSITIEGANGAKYLLHGVEEIIPLARLVSRFGECVAPIRPQGEGFKEYKVPDPENNPEGFERHMGKMGTKKERQDGFLILAGYALNIIKSGIMKKYRS